MVRPKTSRSSAKKEIDGKELLLNTEVQNHNYTSRLGVITALPIAVATNIQVGNEVILHHNVFRRFRDVRGEEKNSKSYYNEDLFFAQPDQIYAYKKDNNWCCVDGYCFIKPIANKDKFSLEHEKAGIGIIKYADEGFEKNDLVGFKPGMEYEFNIEGERLYRVPTNKITIKYEYQGNEEEYNPSWSQSS
jgi:hypothetical protein|tara:strand:- start:7 stop:576 length:570 start_codon:yes stop_codon:yes gene_type:complete